LIELYLADGAAISGVSRGCSCQCDIGRRTKIGVICRADKTDRWWCACTATRGNTSGNVLKEAKIENAIEAHSHIVQVPLFVSQDDKIEIDTRTNEYKRVIRN
jgi:hypothetical protein